jgi:hypothetical protein
VDKFGKQSACACATVNAQDMIPHLNIRNVVFPRLKKEEVRLWYSDLRDREGIGRHD